MNRTINPVEATELPFSHLTALIGLRVAVTVTDHPRHIQNGPWHYAGTVESVYQLNAEGRNLHAGEGNISFIGGLTARWDRHQSVRIEVL